MNIAEISMSCWVPRLVVVVSLHSLPAYCFFQADETSTENPLQHGHRALWGRPLAPERKSQRVSSFRGRHHQRRLGGSGKPSKQASAEPFNRACSRKEQAGPSPRSRMKAIQSLSIKLLSAPARQRTSPSRPLPSLSIQSLLQEESRASHLGSSLLTACPTKLNRHLICACIIMRRLRMYDLICDNLICALYTHRTSAPPCSQRVPRSAVHRRI